MRKRVFVSHATPDRATADALVAKLEEAGIMCWVAPRDVPAGDYYGGAIIDAIQTSELTVLLMSSHSNRSPHVTNEIERSVNYRKPIITVRLEDVAPAREIELHVAARHWVDLVEIGPDGLVRQLRLQLGSLVKSASLQETPYPPEIPGREAPARDEQLLRVQEEEQRQEAIRQKTEEKAAEEARQRQQEALRQQAAAREEQERQIQQEALRRQALANEEQARHRQQEALRQEAAAKEEQERQRQQEAIRPNFVLVRQEAAFNPQFGNPEHIKIARTPIEIEQAATREEQARQRQQEALKQQAAPEVKLEGFWEHLFGIGFVAFLVILALVTLATFVILVYSSTRWLTGHSDVFGHDPQTVTIAAGIAALLILSLFSSMSGNTPKPPV